MDDDATRLNPHGGVDAPTTVEFHVLLVPSGGAPSGYAIMKAVENESCGRIRPEIGSLYRVFSQ